jgi:hypothetical protein
MMAPMWGFAWYLGRLARRTRAQLRWPPSNGSLIRNTTVRTGQAARRYALMLQLSSAFFWAAPVAVGLWFWWLLLRMAA